MKNYVREYRGCRVPVKATHFAEVTGYNHPAFYSDNHIWVIFEGSLHCHQNSCIPRNAIELPEAPQEWNGEGLPPVGCRCSATWLELPDGGCNDFCEVAIKGYFDGEVWLSKVNGVGYSEVLKVKDCEFRPLKTQQEKDLEAFIETVSWYTEGTLLDKDDPEVLMFIKNMFDAGCAAPKAGDNDQE